MVIYFDASDETRNARMMKRDGMLMTKAQSSHVSEQECDLVKGLASAIINTDNMSMEDQASQTIQIINGYINAYA
jgi:dephospho-CoA kinase